MNYLPLILQALLFFSASLCLAQTAGETAKLQTLPKEGQMPFPTAFPKFSSEGAAKYDWKKYIEASVSEADRVFRGHLAYQYGQLPEGLSGLMGMKESTTDEAVRFRLAVVEVSKNCEQLEALYRERLKNDAELLGVLEQFIASHRQALEAEVRLVGGSWDGGSGARAAYPSARLTALLNYRSSLGALRASLHFQDMPSIPIVEPAKDSR